jgi:hypothetical protein
MRCLLKQQLLLGSRKINGRLYATVEVLLNYINGNGVLYVVLTEKLKAGLFEATS